MTINPKRENYTQNLSSPTHHNIFLALGSNLKSPAYYLTLANDTISHHSDFELIQKSNIYLSYAQTKDNTPQNDFYNQVLWCKTTLQPNCLLKYIHSIEQAAGRTRIKKWAARTLDIDILLYEDWQINTERLTIPHAYLTQRDFVLKPLAELLGEDFIIMGKSIATHLATLSETFVYNTLPCTEIEII